MPTLNRQRPCASKGKLLRHTILLSACKSSRAQVPDCFMCSADGIACSMLWQYTHLARAGLGLGAHFSQRRRNNVGCSTQVFFGRSMRALWLKISASLMQGEAGRSVVHQKVRNLNLLRFRFFCLRSPACYAVAKNRCANRLFRFEW